MNFEIWQFTLLFAILMAIAELFTVSFFFLGLASGCLATALAQWLAGNGNFNRDLIVFSFFSGASFYLLRYFFKRPHDISKIKKRDDVNRY